MWIPWICRLPIGFFNFVAYRRWTVCSFPFFLLLLLFYFGFSSDLEDPSWPFNFIYVYDIVLFWALFRQISYLVKKVIFISLVGHSSFRWFYVGFIIVICIIFSNSRVIFGRSNHKINGSLSFIREYFTQFVWISEIFSGMIVFLWSRNLCFLY